MEVYHSEAWGVVCGELWDMKGANVVCRILGYRGALAYQQNITFEQENDTLWLSHVQCNGNETSLSQCVHAGWGQHTCNASQAAGVMCLARDWGEYVLPVLKYYCYIKLPIFLILNPRLCAWLVR